MKIYVNGPATFPEALNTDKAQQIRSGGAPKDAPA
jgi:hypothetical protein